MTLAFVGLFLAASTAGANGSLAKPPQALHCGGACLQQEDYPVWSAFHGETGRITSELSISSNGEVTRCRTVESSSFPALDEGTCEVLAAQARFRPALDEAGQPVAGLFQVKVRWATTQPMGYRPDIYSISYILEPTGALSDCKLLDARFVKGQPKDFSCPKTLRFEPRRNDKKQPVRMLITETLKITETEIR